MNQIWISVAGEMKSQIICDGGLQTQNGDRSEDKKGPARFAGPFFNVLSRK